MVTSLPINHLHYEAGLLLDFYGQLLPARACQVLECYYYEDLTLAEIAGLLQISRQAVHDRLQQGLASLARYEEKLGLASQHARQKDLLACAIRQLEENDMPSAKETLAELDRII